MFSMNRSKMSFSLRQALVFSSFKHLKKLRVINLRNMCSLPNETKSVPHAATNDMIGPPDPVSNLRPVVFHKHHKESNMERTFRQEREEVQKWNEEFWSKHNKSFFKEKQDYIAANLTTQKDCDGGKRQTLTADEMSIFYKAFLDKNWKKHFWYNMEWYKKNLRLVILALRVNIFKFKQCLNRKP